MLGGGRGKGNRRGMPHGRGNGAGAGAEGPPPPALPPSAGPVPRRSERHAADPNAMPPKIHLSSEPDLDRDGSRAGVEDGHSPRELVGDAEDGGQVPLGLPPGGPAGGGEGRAAEHGTFFALGGLRPGGGGELWVLTGAAVTGPGLLASIRTSAPPLPLHYHAHTLASRHTSSRFYC